MTERYLTYDDAQFFRSIGCTVTQLTFEATSLTAKELYRIEVAPAPAPVVEDPRPTARVIRGGEDKTMKMRAAGLRWVYPPVNGTPTPLGAITSGVERV